MGNKRTRFSNRCLLRFVVRADFPAHPGSSSNVFSWLLPILLPLFFLSIRILPLTFRPERGETNFRLPQSTECHTIASNAQADERMRVGSDNPTPVPVLTEYGLRHLTCDLAEQTTHGKFANNAV